ncbi:MAG: hypothetical protein WBA12_14920 [Catalinimonas sp.]
MKKYFFLLLFLTAAAAPLTTWAQAYEQGDKIFQAGIGFGGYSYGFFGNRALSVPPVTAALELGVHEYISAGPYVGYANYRYNYSFFSDNYNITHLAGGLRGSFHYLPLLNDLADLDIDDDKFDFYITLFGGLRFENVSDDFVGRSNDVDVTIGSVLGFRYKFNPGFGAFAELGYGPLSYGTFGLSAHF